VSWAAIALACLSSAPSGAADALQIHWRAPKLYLDGEPFVARVEIEATSATSIPGWIVEPGAFQLEGQPLAERKSKESLSLGAGTKLALELDLADAIRANKRFEKHDFKLGFGHSAAEEKPVEVHYLVAVEKGVDFMNEGQVPTAELASYQVMLRTNRGDMLFELWPEIAPNHVRNFLDLSLSGFYKDTLFHRVMPGFMIQGGDPNTKTPNRASWGMGGGPRQVKKEFSAKKHEKGVLSMARGDDPNSATCQFFVVHGPSPMLDGKYSVFGKLVDGFETLDRIVSAPGQVSTADRTIQPTEPQQILKAIVLQKPTKK
jgi:cyclophilin family peptidyl-prolyl cis-trans isomerase